MLDVAYANFRDAQAELDSTPTTPAEVRALLEEIADQGAKETAFCCYAPTPYPSGKASSGLGESILADRCGDMASSMAEEHEARD